MGAWRGLQCTISYNYIEWLRLRDWQAYYITTPLAPAAVAALQGVILPSTQSILAGRQIALECETHLLGLG